MYKFRTMHHNADDTIHRLHVQTYINQHLPMTKLDNLGDQRLIAGARIIRRLGIDEVPQLINVLRGELSLVGPRPCLTEEYDAQTASARRRYQLTPGITGLWVISGKNRLTFPQMVALDRIYAKSCKKRCCFCLDLRILFFTPFAVLRECRADQKGASILKKP